MTLQEIYNQLQSQGHESDKGSIHSYIEVYEDILRPYRYTATNILEIGLLAGASLRMWEKYFTGTVYGIDCDIKPIGGRYDLEPIIAEGNHKIIIGNAENPEVIKQHFSGIKFDVIIEDANHSVEQQLKLYENFQPYMNKGGLYIIEDIQDVKNFPVILTENEVRLIDLRHVKNRYDDCIIVIKCLT